jgi:hypothetical protein
MNTPHYETLKPYLPQLQAHLSRFPFIHSAFSIVYLAAWCPFFRYEIRMVDEIPCVFAHNTTGCFMYWPPLADAPGDNVLGACFSYMGQMNGDGSAISRMEHVPRVWADFYAKKGYKTVIKNYDYCYYKASLAELHGQPYKRYRNAIHHLENTGSVEVRPYRTEDFQGCMDVLAGWICNRRERYSDETHRIMLDDTPPVHQFLLSRPGDLPLTIRVLTVDGRIRGYTWGYPLSLGIFCVMAEVADLSLTGVSACLSQAFCRDSALADYRFINAMDDAGLAHLRRHKLRYQPVFLEPVYTVYRQ